MTPKSCISRKIHVYVMGVQSPLPIVVNVFSRTNKNNDERQS